MATTLTPPAQDVSPASPVIEAHVQRVLQSPHFARAETQRKLLQYLWEHRNDAISEYAIATEALGRNSRFDSTIDASVRVHISRLRRKLKDYYLQEPGEPELLVIPTGTHQLMVLDPLPSISEPEPTEAPAKPWIETVRPYFLPLLSSLCVLLAFTVGFLLWKNHWLQQRAGNPAQPNAFWRPFLQGDAPIKIILPTPIVFAFPAAPSIRLRSVDINDFHDMNGDPKFQELIRGLGKPEVTQPYTVTWDTLAAIDMARYLDSIGTKNRVSFEVTRDSSMMILEQANVIMLGTHHTLQPVHEYLQSMNFSLAEGEMWVSNANPEPGEQARYEVIHETSPYANPHRQIEPSIIALLPGRTPGLKVLLLEAGNTGALVSLLTSAAGSHSVMEMWHKHGNPPFFEMVVQTETEGTHALRVWPVTMHAYRKPAPANMM